MKLSTRKLKKELGIWEKALSRHISERMSDLFSEIIHKEFLGQKKIHVFDLIVRIVHRADKASCRAIANLMVMINFDEDQAVDKEEMEKSIGLVRDYFNDVDRIDLILYKKQRIEKENALKKERPD